MTTAASVDGGRDVKLRSLGNASRVCPFFVPCVVVDYNTENSVGSSFDLFSYYFPVLHF